MPDNTNLLPHHVAIVMDGNGRWAKQRFLPRLVGHQQGVQTLKQCIVSCISKNIRVLTVFAFSSENWGRPDEEVSGLMELLCKTVVSDLSELKQKGVRICFIGARQTLTASVLEALQRAESATENNDKMVLNVCFNYGGRWDIAQAAVKLAQNQQEITESSLHAAMAMSHVPDPDLIIRTGGERRISNFLLWQCAYSELYFTDVLWPDFNEAQLDTALQDYAKRERRFGKTSAQLQKKGASC